MDDQPKSNPKSGDKIYLGLCRVLISIGLAVATFVVMMLWVWHNNGLSFDTPRYYTSMQGRKIRYELDQHYQQYNVYPEKLTRDFLERNNPESSWPDDDQLLPVPDIHWQRPWVYRVTDQGYDLYSLGADGRPGGTDADADVYGDERDQVGFVYFFTRLVSPGLWFWASCISCFVAFVPGLKFGAKRDTIGRQTAWAIKVVIIIVMSVVIGVIMAGIHILNGH